MNLHDGHFLFTGQKHDARCTCCCLQQDVVLCSLTFIERDKNSTQLLPVTTDYAEVTHFSRVGNKYEETQKTDSTI